MKNKKSSEEINPWTHRQRQTSIYLIQQSQNQNNVHVNPFTPHNSNVLAPKKLKDNNHNKIPTNLFYTIPQKSQSNFANKKSHSKENYIRFSQILPNYKTIRFQNTRPKYSKSRSSTKSKDKYSSFTSHSNRQYIEDLFSQIKKQEKLKPNQKSMKTRRYYTEQKDEEAIQINILAHKQPELAKISKTQGTKRCQFAIKIIKTNKGIGSIQQSVKKGKLYEKVQAMMDSNGKQGGHLSQMKRNYNIKKLLKLIKEEQV